MLSPGFEMLKNQRFLAPTVSEKLTYGIPAVAFYYLAGSERTQILTIYKHLNIICTSLHSKWI